MPSRDPHHENVLLEDNLMLINLIRKPLRGSSNKGQPYWFSWVRVIVRINDFEKFKLNVLFPAVYELTLLYRAYVSNKCVEKMAGISDFSNSSLSFL